MEIEITQIIIVLIGLMGVIITSVIVPLMKSKLTQNQWDMLMSYAVAGVQAAEIIFNAQGKGTEKFEWAKEYIEAQCKKHGIKIDMDTIQVAIESAWKSLGLDREHEKVSK